MGRESRSTDDVRTALLDAAEAFEDVAASLAGFVVKLEAQGFTPEQARELTTAIISRAMRERDTTP